MKRNIIPIGCDHAGYLLKNSIISALSSKGYECLDFGCLSEESIDYPDYAHAVSNYITENEGTMGILICGSGNGINMTANKHQDVRSALCWNNEIALLARQHNNANIIAIPARFITIEEAITMVDTFLNTNFEGGRHQLRVNKINC
jgi:ribose 5-phosphate isomerase B